jgi:hypothetical protein
VSQNKTGSDELEHLNSQFRHQLVAPSDDVRIRESWSSTSHHFRSVAQSEEQPVVYGKAEGALRFATANRFTSGIHMVRLGKSIPFGSAILSERSSVSALPINFEIAAVVEYIRHPPSKRNDAGETAVRDSEPFNFGHLNSRTWEVHSCRQRHCQVVSK